MLNFIQSVSSGFSAIIGHDIVGAFGGGAAINEIFTFIVQKLPDGGRLPDGVHSAAIYFGNDIGKVNFILPVDVLISCLVIIVSLKVTMFGFHLFMWVINFIRGVATPTYRTGGLPGYDA